MHLNSGRVCYLLRVARRSGLGVKVVVMHIVCRLSARDANIIVKIRVLNTMHNIVHNFNAAAALIQCALDYEQLLYRRDDSFYRIHSLAGLWNIVDFAQGRIKVPFTRIVQQFIGVLNIARVLDLKSILDLRVTEPWCLHFDDGPRGIGACCNALNRQNIICPAHIITGLISSVEKGHGSFNSKKIAVCSTE